MDIVVIFNGLGNQMSQYSLYLSKKKYDPTTRYIFKRSYIHHNGYELDKVFGIKYPKDIRSELLYYLYRLCATKEYPFITKPVNWFLNLIRIRLIMEKENYDFDQEVLMASKGLNFYFGGWHSEKYFRNIQNDIRNAFIFNIDNHCDNENVLKIITNIQSVNSVSIHVRRGDYLTSPDNFNKFGDICTKEYYFKAINLIKDQILDPCFFVFSDDFSWVKENLTLQNVTYVDINSGSDSWIDMYLISLCKHNICANSTFSWWGAWLNKNKDKIIISPDNFVNNIVTKDLFPEDWIKIDKF